MVYFNIGSCLQDIKVKIKNMTKDRILCDQALMADTFLLRGLGLMFRKEWKDFNGFLLMPCGSIHTCCMRIPIDVCFLDRERKILKVVKRLGPWKFVSGGKGSHATLELPEGTVQRTETEAGDKLEIES